MKEKPMQVYMFGPQKAQDQGHLVDDGFLVKAGSTAMRNGSPMVKRDREERDRLVRIGVLVRDSDAELFRFARDHVCSSASQASGIVKDGNCSGPQSWKNVASGKTLQDDLRIPA
jgi:hypothetical protein